MYSRRRTDTFLSSSFFCMRIQACCVMQLVHHFNSKIVLISLFAKRFIDEYRASITCCVFHAGQHTILFTCKLIFKQNSHLNPFSKISIGNYNIFVFIKISNNYSPTQNKFLLPFFFSFLCVFSDFALKLNSHNFKKKLKQSSWACFISHKISNLLHVQCPFVKS